MMASFLTRPILRAAQTTRVISKPRNYAVIAGSLPNKPARSSDITWILGATAVFVPTMAYLMTPEAAKHSATSHAHPVPDRWSRSFAEEDIKPEKLNRPIMADDDGIVPAGEGRPHGPGDKSIREITKPTETHAGLQVSMHKDQEHFGTPPEVMNVARAHTAQRPDNSTGMDTKAIVAEANVQNQSKHA